MGRKSKKLKNFTTEQLEALYKSDSSYLTGVKLFAIIQLHKGFSSHKLSEFYGASFKQICNWADRFDAEGINGLRMKPGRGRRSFLTVEQTNQLRVDLLKCPSDFGYNAVKWTGRIIREHIKGRFHVEYKHSAVYSLIHRSGLKIRG
jgi:transposase